MSHSRRIGGIVAILLVMLLLGACGGSTTPQAQKTTPTLPPPTPTPGQGTLLLNSMAQKINTARTLHGLFNLQITGQALSGSVDSEIWNASPNKNRSVVRQSSISQFSIGSTTVTNGKQLWQYDPTKKVVYTGPVTVTTGTPTAGASGDQTQFVLNLVQSVFTHSDATLASSSAKIHGHDAYDIHVVPQARPSSNGSSGLDRFNYTGDVYIDKTMHLPLEVNLTIDGLGQVVLDIPMLILNQPIPDSTFTFAVPPGVKVLPLQQANSTSGTGSITLAQAEQQAGYHLLSIPSTQTNYELKSVEALGSVGSQIYTLNYSMGNTSFTIAEGKPLANVPISGGQQVSLRGTTGTLSTVSGSTTLTWTENGVGIGVTGPLSNAQILSIAKLLT